MQSPAASLATTSTLKRNGRRKLRHWLCWLVRLQLQMCGHWPRGDPRSSVLSEKRAARTEPLAVLVGEGAAIDLRAVPQRLAAREAARPAALVGADGVVAPNVPACPLPAIDREPCRERPKGFQSVRGLLSSCSLVLATRPGSERRRVPCRPCCCCCCCKGLWPHPGRLQRRRWTDWLADTSACRCSRWLG